MAMWKAQSQAIKHVLFSKPQADHPLTRVDHVGPEIAEAWYEYFSRGNPLGILLLK